MGEDAQLEVATGDVVCVDLKEGSLLSGCEYEGICIHALRSAKNTALIGADLSKIPLADLRMVVDLRRLGLHWVTTRRFRERQENRGAVQLLGLKEKQWPRKTLRASQKCFLPKKVSRKERREDAHRWAVIQQTVKVKNTAGRDFVWASYLATEARKRAADGRERAALWIAWLFGYGCKLVQPILLAAFVSLVAAIALGAQRSHISPSPDLSGLFLDIAASPVSSLREGGGLNESTTALVGGRWLRLLMIFNAVFGTLGYFSAVIAAVRYMRSNRSIEVS